MSALTSPASGRRYRVPGFLSSCPHWVPPPPQPQPNVAPPPHTKLLTYVEYRAVSGVFQNIDFPPPLHPASVFRSVTHSPGGEGVGGQFLEDARHWIGLLQYNPSTPPPRVQGGDTLACGEGGGGTQFRRRDRCSGTLCIVKSLYAACTKKYS
jgi:hypothetical protein